MSSGGKEIRRRRVSFWLRGETRVGGSFARAIVRHPQDEEERLIKREESKEGLGGTQVSNVSEHKRGLYL